MGILQIDTRLERMFSMDLHFLGSAFFLEKQQCYDHFTGTDNVGKEQCLAIVKQSGTAFLWARQIVLRLLGS